MTRHYSRMCSNEGRNLTPGKKSAHGIAPKAEGGTIFIQAEQRNNELNLHVSDNGKGCEEVKNNGIGLSNIQNRLNKIYGDKATFKVLNKNGFSVDITIPVTQ